MPACGPARHACVLELHWWLVPASSLGNVCCHALWLRQGKATHGDDKCSECVMYILGPDTLCYMDDERCHIPEHVTVTFSATSGNR